MEIKHLIITTVLAYCCLLVASTNQQSSAAKKVQVALYYESLCPGCQEFITSSLAVAVAADGISEILDLRLIPYGNAKEIEATPGVYNFTCQHGPKECEGNIIEECALYLNKNDTFAAFPFILCMEKLLENFVAPSDALRSCSKTPEFYSQITKCTGSSLGNQLMHQNAVETKNLKPAHQYVPWIVVDSEHSEEIQNEVSDNMLAYVCSHYKGPLPKGCPKQKQRTAPVCYRD